jgi:ABC-type transport system involved in multi-copper enzyme maturation permease subunit
MSIRPLTAQISITMKEILRGGTVIGLFIAWILLLLTATAFGSVSIGERVFVIKDFGLFLTTLSVVCITFIAGSGILSKEIRQKNIYTVLSKPISRFSYLTSKWLGLWIVGLIINTTLHFSLCFYLFLFEGSWHFSILSNILFLGIEGLILSALTLVIASLFVTPMLVGIITFLLFVVGRNLDTISNLLEKTSTESALSYILEIVKSVLPHLYLLNVTNDLTYSIVPSLATMLSASVYGFSYATACFILSLFIFSRRTFN